MDSNQEHNMFHKKLIKTKSNKKVLYLIKNFVHFIYLIACSFVESYVYLSFLTLLLFFVQLKIPFLFFLCQKDSTITTE